MGSHFTVSRQACLTRVASWLHGFQVGELELDLLAGTLAARLFAGLRRPAMTALLPKASKACTSTWRKPLP